MKICSVHFFDMTNPPKNVKLSKIRDGEKRSQTYVFPNYMHAHGRHITNNGSGAHCGSGYCRSVIDLILQNTDNMFEYNGSLDLVG